jgi:hypothetical protein
MVSFDPKNPFPLVEGYSYEEAKAHARAVDRYLGFQIEEMESTIARTYPQFVNTGTLTREFWIGLDVQAMLTPYLELRSMLHQIQPQPDQTMTELGSGYSRLAHVLRTHYPEVNYIGLEFLQERVDEAKRVLGPEKHHQILRSDITHSEFVPPAADVYFMYDFGSQAGVRKILRDLKDLARLRSIQVIGRGRATRQIIEREEPWLSSVNSPRHFPNFSIYIS